MGLFDKGEKEVSRKDFWKAIEKDSGRVPGSGWKKIDYAARRKIGREVFSRYGKYGSKIQVREFKSALKKMDAERKSLRKQADVLAKKGDMFGAKKLKKQAMDIRAKIGVLSRVGGGKWGKSIERKRNW